jgi:nitroreductase
MDLATVDHLLTTTRSVRKRLDFTRPVPREVIEECLDVATQAPTGGNRQGWHFLVVTDAEKRKRIGEWYGQAWYAYAQQPRPQYAADDPRAAQLPRVVDSAQYLADHMHEAPVLVIPCVTGRVETLGVGAQAGLYGSILPAAWSFMLALRARGLGSAWTTLHLTYEKEIAALLNIPNNITQAALLPVAYFKGEDFKAAARVPAKDVTHWNGW